MNKPLSMIIKETQTKIINACNDSGLPPAILDLVIQGIYSNIHSISEKQYYEEEKSYIKAFEESAKSEGDTNAEE